MVHRRPHMLQRRPHLKLEAVFVQFGQRRIAEQRRRNLADVVQRHVAKVIDIMHLPLVNRIFPVDVEHLLNQRRDLVDFVAVICDDADADQIRHVTDLTVLLALELQLAGKALLRLHTAFNADDDSVLSHHRLQIIQKEGQHLLKCRLVLQKLPHQFTAMTVHDRQ